jgi:hypothetical protein
MHKKFLLVILLAHCHSADWHLANCHITLNFRPRANVKKLSGPQFKYFCSKVECLTLTSFSSLVLVRKFGNRLECLCLASLSGISLMFVSKAVAYPIEAPEVAPL